MRPHIASRQGHTEDKHILGQQAHLRRPFRAYALAHTCTLALSATQTRKPSPAPASIQWSRHVGSVLRPARNAGPLPDVQCQQLKDPANGNFLQENIASTGIRTMSRKEVTSLRRASGARFLTLYSPQRLFCSLPHPSLVANTPAPPLFSLWISYDGRNSLCRISLRDSRLAQEG